MEKRRQKTLPRTNNWVVACAKYALIAVLFVPGFLTAYYVVPDGAERDLEQVTKHTEKTRSNRITSRLTRIFAIVKSSRPDIADKEVWKVSTTILNESAKRNIDPMLVLAVIKVESGFRNQAVSPEGARGIMQIMPDTGKYLSEELFRVDGFPIQSFTPDHLDDPVLNIKLGVYYLNGLKKQFRNLSLALLAYNLGPGEMQNRLENNIQFSDEYAAVVLTAYHEYKKVDAAVF
jgi:soluble lytic murein transglycosylase-like protein